MNVTGFENVAGRLVGEQRERVALGRMQRLTYTVGFLDDYLKAILPHDVVLIGAPTGVGKTELAMKIAFSNARTRPVAYFALEAEPREIERRMKYSILIQQVWNRYPDRARDMNYTEWMLGDFEDVCAEFNRPADIEIANAFGMLRTFYKEGDFTAENLVKKIKEVHRFTDLIVVDHLHYIDDENEDHGAILKAIRSCALEVGKPVIVVAHIRKKEAGSRTAQRLVTPLDDFHGSSNVTKIATQAVMIEPAPREEGEPYHLAATFMQVLKCRRLGPCRLVARAIYNQRTKGYEDGYTLGRLTHSGSKWAPLGTAEVPSWARRHEPLSAQLTTPGVA